MSSSNTLKRALDLTVAVPALIVSAPVQACVALLVRRKLGGPVLFRQSRPGQNGVPFEILKFRTMLDVDESRGLISDADRLTPFGARLRRTSLDELPALLNVIRGDMSLVGPRPLLMQYLPLYSQEQSRRHNVKPGLTGLAQVSGRNDITWDNRLALDVEYVEQQNFLLDVQILLKTVAPLILRRGIENAESVTMPPFVGS